MPARIQIPFSFNYASGGNLLVPAAGASVAVYIRNPDGSQGSSVPVYQAQQGASQYSSLITDSAGNVPGWVAEGTYKIVAAATGGFGGGTINFDAIYGGGTFLIAPNAVDTPQLSTAVQASLVPSGTILDHGGSGAPAGFLSCDGSVIAQASYPNLYNAIGTNWNTSGEGAGNFRLPNLIGTMTIGRGTASWGTVRTLGKYGLPSGGTYLGEENHGLVTAELPVHSHPNALGDPGHAHSIYDPGHAHGTPSYMIPSGGGYAAAGGGAWSLTYSSGTYSAGTGIGIYSSGTGVTISNGNAGSGSTHNNMPPFAVVNKIIKY